MKAVITNVEQHEGYMVVTYSTGTTRRYYGRTPETARQWLWENGGKQKVEAKVRQERHDREKREANPFNIESCTLQDGKYAVRYWNGRIRHFSAETLPGTAKRFMAWEKEWESKY